MHSSIKTSTHTIILISTTIGIISASLAFVRLFMHKNLRRWGNTCHGAARLANFIMCKIAILNWADKICSRQQIDQYYCLVYQFIHGHIERYCTISTKINNRVHIPMHVYSKRMDNQMHVPCWQLLSNQSVYRQFAGYGKGLGHHKVGQ